jgi:hypothetical protein
MLPHIPPFFLNFFITISDELETISTRTLAQSRYQRNHEFMNDVFVQAAFGKWEA